MLRRSARFVTSKLLHVKQIDKTVRVNLVRANQPNVAGSEFAITKLIKPFVFTVSFCGGSFVAATIWKYENSRSKKLSFANFRRNDRLPRDDPLYQLRHWWKSQTEAFKIFCGIAAANVVVFGLWKVPAYRSFMMRYFMSSLESKSYRCLPMVLSNLSHFSLTHIGVNMFVLYSFSNVSIYTFGKEDFLALYFASGVVSSFASLAYKVATRSLVPSLGASGAILGILGAACTERPDIQLMIIFLPFFSFSSATALKGIILMDSLGAILRWGFFDHAAHLGGTLFGVLYASRLREQIDRNRGFIIKQWIQLKQRF